MNSSFYDPANNQNSNLFTNPVNDPTNDNNNPLNYPVNDAANYSSSNTTNYPFNNPYSSTSTDKPRSPSKIITELQKKRKHSDDEVEIEGNSSLD
jgi:hypothetical protein